MFRLLSRRSFGGTRPTASQAYVIDRSEAKEKVIELAREGHSVRIVAANVGISTSTVGRWIKSAREAGVLETVPKMRRETEKKRDARKTRAKENAEPASQLSILDRIRVLSNKMLDKLEGSIDEGEKLPYRVKELRDILKVVQDLAENIEAVKIEVEIAVSNTLAALFAEMPDETQTELAEVIRGRIGN